MKDLKSQWKKSPIVGKDEASKELIKRANQVKELY